MEIIAHGITGNNLQIVEKYYTNVTFVGKNFKIKRIHYKSNPEPLQYELD